MFENLDLTKLIFGRLTWDAIPFHDPIILGTFAVVALGGIALLAALTRILEGQLYLPPDIMRRPPAEAQRTPSVDEDVKRRLCELTGKQLEVLIRLSHGASNKVIARELDIAETTVKTHVSAILRKLGVTGRVQAILTAGSVDLDALLAERHEPSR